jgi:PLP dependent protein
MEFKAPALPKDIRWHFIGHLQTNKVKDLLNCAPNLAVVESVDSARLASKLNSRWAALNRDHVLEVMVQVNTSGEATKFGIDPKEAVPLAKHIVDTCPSLRLAGLMTIGMADYTSTPVNFKCLDECRTSVAEAISVPPKSLHLSMGMSGDFEMAIQMGSTNVRVGSSIFGPRPPKISRPSTPTTPRADGSSTAAEGK